MKKVVSGDRDYVVLSDVSSSKYYGFILGKLGKSSPGFIQAEDMLDNPCSFRAKFFFELTNGNGYGHRYDTLKNCIRNLLLNLDAEVYEFNTYQELFAWASKQ